MSRHQHALAAAGAPFNPDGIRLTAAVPDGPRDTTAPTSGDGHAKCACGTISADPYPSASARRAWHRRHKAALGH